LAQIVALFYTIFFVPFLPIATICLIWFRVGLIPMSPLLAYICSIVAGKRFKAQFAEAWLAVPSGWRAGMVPGVVVKALFDHSRKVLIGNGRTQKTKAQDE
jgi:Na+/proline symporter